MKRKSLTNARTLLLPSSICFALFISETKTHNDIGNNLVIMLLVCMKNTQTIFKNYVIFINEV